MVTEVQRPSGVNVGVNNPGEIVYIKGNETTDGSIRFILNTGDDEVTFEERATGVWNPTGLRLASSTLFLDRILALSSVGITLQINALGSNRKFLVPCVEFDDTGSFRPQAQVIDALEEDVVIQGVFGTEIIGQIISGSTTFTNGPIITKLNLKTGSTAATDDVTLIMFQGLFPSGTKIFDINFPSSQFPANSDITIDLQFGVGFVQGDEVTFAFFSNEDFSLLGNSSDSIFLTVDVQINEFQTLITTPDGTDRFLVDNSSLLIVDNAGNVMLEGN